MTAALMFLLGIFVGICFSLLWGTMIDLFQIWLEP